MIVIFLLVSLRLRLHVFWHSEGKTQKAAGQLTEISGGIKDICGYFFWNIGIHESFT